MIPKYLMMTMNKEQQPGWLKHRMKIACLRVEIRKLVEQVPEELLEELRDYLVDF
jgi:hypothetical protein